MQILNKRSTSDNNYNSNKLLLSHHINWMCPRQMVLIETPRWRQLQNPTQTGDNSVVEKRNLLRPTQKQVGFRQPRTDKPTTSSSPNYSTDTQVDVPSQPYVVDFQFIVDWANIELWRTILNYEGCSESIVVISGRDIFQLIRKRLRKPFCRQFSGGYFFILRQNCQKIMAFSNNSFMKSIFTFSIQTLLPNKTVSLITQNYCH